VLLYAYNEGEDGHKLEIHDIVVGSANVGFGHIAKHSEFVVFIA
jgi:hypothetical protein